MWNAGFFAPTPLSLTFSEHFVPQALQGLPVYLAGGDILLAFNLVFLATFTLSGLGTFLLVRELTGSARAAFVAGLFYAFFPYRLNQLPHLQTLSSQWIPFALYGFRRHFDTGRWLPLAGGTAAFVVQGLSSGYYLFFVAPVLAAYVVWELASRGRLAQWRAWAAVGVAGGAALLATLPFLLPYAEARERFGLTRPFAEMRRLLGRPVRLHERAGAVASVGRQAERAGPKWKAISLSASCRWRSRSSRRAMWAKRLALTIREATVGAPGARAAARAGADRPDGADGRRRASRWSPPAGSCGMWAACRSA